MDIKISTQEHLQVRGHYFNWPYFVYTNKDCNLFILNAYDPQIANIVRIGIENERSGKFKILENFITDTNDLIVVGRF